MASACSLPTLQIRWPASSWPSNHLPCPPLLRRMHSSLHQHLPSRPTQGSHWALRGLRKIRKLWPTFLGGWRRFSPAPAKELYFSLWAVLSLGSTSQPPPWHILQSLLPCFPPATSPELHCTNSFWSVENANAGLPRLGLPVTVYSQIPLQPYSRDLLCG